MTHAPDDGGHIFESLPEQANREIITCLGQRMFV